MRINVKSAGRRLDYEWDDAALAAESAAWTDALHDMDELYSMAIRCAADGTYGIYMGAMLPPEGIRDNHGRFIRVSYLIQDLSEQQCRSLAVCYLQDKKLLEETLCGAEVLTFGSFFQVNKENAAAALNTLLSQQDLPEPQKAAPGNYWAEKTPGDRVPEAVAFLQHHRLSNLPGYRVVCSELLHVDRLNGREDLCLLWGNEARYAAVRKQPDTGSATRLRVLAIGIPALVLLLIGGILYHCFCKGAAAPSAPARPSDPPPSSAP